MNGVHLLLSIEDGPDLTISRFSNPTMSAAQHYYIWMNGFSKPARTHRNNSPIPHSNWFLATPNEQAIMIHPSHDPISHDCATIPSPITTPNDRPLVYLPGLRLSTLSLPFSLNILPQHYNPQLTQPTQPTMTSMTNAMVLRRLRKHNNHREVDSSHTTHIIPHQLQQKHAVTHRTNI